MSDDLKTLTNEEIAERMDVLRDEIDRRERVLLEARNGRPKGPGRPKNGSSTTRLTAAEMEPAEQ